MSGFRIEEIVERHLFNDAGKEIESGDSIKVSFNHGSIVYGYFDRIDDNCLILQSDADFRKCEIFLNVIVSIIS